MANIVSEEEYMTTDNLIYNFRNACENRTIDIVINLLPKITELITSDIAILHEFHEFRPLDKLWLLTHYKFVENIDPEIYITIFRYWINYGNMKDYIQPDDIINYFEKLINDLEVLDNKQPYNLWMIADNIESILTLFENFSITDFTNIHIEEKYFKFLTKLFNDIPHNVIINYSILQNIFETISYFITNNLQYTNFLDVYKAIGKYLTQAKKYIPDKYHSEYEFYNGFHFRFNNQYHTFTTDIQSISYYNIYINLLGILKNSEIYLNPDYHYNIFIPAVVYDKPELVDILLKKYNIPKLDDDISSSSNIDNYLLNNDNKPSNFKVIEYLHSLCVTHQANKVWDYLVSTGYTTIYRQWFNNLDSEKYNIIYDCGFPVYEYFKESPENREWMLSKINMCEYMGSGMIIKILSLIDSIVIDIPTVKIFLDNYTDEIINYEPNKKYLYNREISNKFTNNIISYVKILQYNYFTYITTHIETIKLISDYGIINNQIYEKIITEYFINILFEIEEHKLYDLKLLYEKYQPPYTDYYWLGIMSNHTLIHYNNLIILLREIYPDEKPSYEYLLQLFNNNNYRIPYGTRKNNMVKIFYYIFAEYYTPNDVDDNFWNLLIIKLIENNIPLINSIMDFTIIVRYPGCLDNFKDQIIQSLSDIGKYNKPFLLTTGNDICYILNNYFTLKISSNIFNYLIHHVLENTDEDEVVFNDKYEEFITKALDYTIFDLNREYNTEINVSDLIFISYNEHSKIQNNMNLWANWASVRSINIIDTSLIELCKQNCDVIDSETVTEKLEYICPISLEPLIKGDIAIKLTRCGHIFAPNMITRWIQEHDTCPFCRCNIEGFNSENCQLLKLC